MAGDIDTNIYLTATGGDASASEIAKASAALDNVAASSGRMQAKFQERFEHIGLQIFAGDLLKTVGLGGETRQAVMLLQTAMVGLGTGGVMLVVAALGALAAAAITVIEHQKTMLDQTGKAVEADDKQLKSITDSISALEQYGNAVGSLNKVQSDYLGILQQSHDLQVKKENDDLIDRITVLNQAIAKEKEHASTIDIVGSVVKGTTVTFGDNAKAVEATNAKIAQLTLELGKATSAMNLLHTYGTTDMSAITKSTEEAAKATEDAWAESANARLDDINEETKAMISANEIQKKATESAMKEQEQTVKLVSGQIGGDLGNAFAKSLVEGKKFTDEMKAAFTQMAEQMISDMVKMAVEAAALSAMGLPVGGAAGGAGGILGKFFGGGFASGGDMMVDKPTLFMAGEAGPERATFTPLSGMGADDGGGMGDGSGGTSIGNISVNVSVNGVNDPKAIAQEVGQAIIEQIRGAGQVAFTRS